MCQERSAKGLERAPQILPALEVEGSRAVVTAQEITTFFAAIAAVVVGGPAASPGLLLRLPTPLFCLVRLGGSQQSLDLLHTHTNGVCAHSELQGCPSPPLPTTRRGFSVTHPSPPFVLLPSIQATPRTSQPPEPRGLHPNRVAAAQEQLLPNGEDQDRGMGRRCAVPSSPLPCMDSGGLQSQARERPEARY